MSVHAHKFTGFTSDREEARTHRSPFEKSRSIEHRYAKVLRFVARQVGAIINGFPDPVEEPRQLDFIDRALKGYAELLTPWAEAVAARVVSEVDEQDRVAWNKHARTMSRSLRHELANAPTGAALRAFQDENVALITSLPTEAAQRVHRLTTEALSTGRRAEDISREIARSGEVTASRATLIARTEVARTASGLTMVRAVAVGSTAYVWQTARDSDVRPSHRQMQGKVITWSEPPTLSDGTTTHAGMIYNCRCYPAPIVPDD